VSIYQPIVSLGDGGMIGYEALARPGGGAADMSVEGMFKTAAKIGLGSELDWFCRRAAIQGANSLPAGTLLFVNVSIPALLDPLHDVDQMLLLLRWARRQPSDVVLEISERDAVSDLARFRQVLSAYREAGFRFAIDDVGEGHSTLEVLAASTPEYIKVARKLVETTYDPGSRAAVSALVAFARTTGSVVIAEGIETDEQAREMRELGVQVGQGYRLGRPGPLLKMAPAV